MEYLCAYPECSLCTWIVQQPPNEKNGRYWVYLKYVNRLCQQHVSLLPEEQLR
jgi:hypothetical protein